MSDKPSKEIWLPTSHMTVVIAGGVLGMTETFDMELKPVPPKPGFQPKEATPDER